MWTYLPQLDGLRAIAVYLVLLYHARLSQVTGGFIGVDLFFVLSGFLVSNVIFAEIDKRGRFSLGGFYARRVRRLLPAAVLVVVATSVAFVIVSDVVRRISMVSDARAALLYYANWHFLSQSTDYFAQDLEPSPFLHFWSLAVEEQFYIFFPILIAILVRRATRFARATAVVCGILFAGSVASQIFWAFREPNHAYYGTDARLYQLLAGVLLALLLRARPQVLAGVRGRVLSVAGIVAILLFASNRVDVSASVRGFVATGASVAVIGGLTMLPDGWLARLLSRPTPVYLGKISYGTYLWHWPVILVLREVLTVRPYTIAALAFALSTGLAALSYQIFELPIRTQPRLVTLRWSAVLAGLTTSALVAAFLVAPVLQADRLPALRSFGGASAAAAAAKAKIPGDGPVPKGIDWKAAVHDLGHSKNCPATDVKACMVVANNGPLVLVVGDSFANMLGPMFVKLARDHGFSLAQNVVQGCPWPSDLVDSAQTHALQSQCATAREHWYATALPQLKPALVVLVMKPRDTTPHLATLEKSRSGQLSSLTPSQLIYRTMSDTVKQIRGLGPKVLLLQSVLDASPALPLNCLARSTRLSQCAVKYPTVFPASDGYMQALAASLAGVSTASIDPVVCPTPPLCVPYRGGQIVFRDRHHIMTGFAVANRAKIWDLFVRSGATQGL
ncbi:MAG: acyltransferase [Marmoricola sp.]|nr:acyltransferase [Marmoricola sp.]